MDNITNLITEKFKEQELLFSTKFEQLQSRITDELSKAFDKKLSIIELSFQSKIDNLTTELSSLKTQLVEIQNKQNEDPQQKDISDLQSEIFTLKSKQAEQIDRSLRSTLILKKVPYNNETEKTWEDTKVVVASEISKHCPKLRFDYVKKSIERCHRNFKNDHSDPKLSIPSISVKLCSWKDSSSILNTIINSNKMNKRKSLMVSQQFSEETSKRRNSALKERRELINSNDGMEYKLNYPATLLGRMKNSDDGFKVIKTF